LFRIADDLNDLVIDRGGIFIEAGNAINNRGQIIASNLRLTPTDEPPAGIPEPTMLVLFSPAVTGLTAGRSRSSRLHFAWLTKRPRPLREESFATPSAASVRGGTAISVSRS